MTQAATAAWRDVMESHSSLKLEWGPTNVDRFLGDPKRIAFFFSRYKFAAKMLARCRSIIDVGCGDGMGAVTFLSDTQAAVVGLDFEPSVIEYAERKLMPAIAKARPDDVNRISFVQRDFTEGPHRPHQYEGLCSLDMIEHLDPQVSDWVLAQFAMVLKPYGVAVIGTPSALAAQYASVHSQAGHINLYEPDGLRAALERCFSRVFLFSMNDEVVHTGFDRMAHYLIGVCVK